MLPRASNSVGDCFVASYILYKAQTNIIVFKNIRIWHAILDKYIVICAENGVHIRSYLSKAHSYI